MSADEGDQVFTSVEVCEHLDITYRRLDWWARQGYVAPSVQEADGPGTQRLWSVADLERVREIRDVMNGPRRLANSQST